jgi:hypothetical protein
MSNTKKRKGDAAEREAAELITALLGLLARRALGAGRQDDVGDIHGVPGHAIQVASWKDVSRAALVKPPQAEQQRINAGAAHASTWVRFRGGNWRVVLTPEQWAALVRQTPLGEPYGGLDHRQRIAQGLDQEWPAS